jgi:biofilm PGA synthesis N-glycosyltransferase PgaC
VNYAIITPVRNEGSHLAKTIESMAAQTIRPIQWVIVNDGSTDQTPLLIDAAAKTHPWISPLHRPDRGYRKSGGGVIDAFYDGYALLKEMEKHCTLPPNGGAASNEGNPFRWSFLAKLDGDLSFEKDYFEKCLARFSSDKSLGIGGGRVYCHVNGQCIDDSPGDPAFHVRGATKIYRRKTWDAIGGLLRAPGWDTLDEVKANMLGWKTYSFADLHVVQLKPTGAADGTWRNWFKNGRANYISGYHPLFMLSKCIRRSFKKPFIVASCGLLAGYVSGYLKKTPRVPDPELIRYLRRQQISRLLLQPSLWNS